MGWQPDLPDPRDYTFRHPKVLPLLRRLKQTRPETLPTKIDLRADCDGRYLTTSHDQGPLACASVFAVLSLVEYFERRVRGHTFEASPRFLYKVSRNQMQQRRRVTGDTGADLRSTLKALVRFGVPPDEHWPYDVENFDEEPSAFIYHLAAQPRGMRYFRLDGPNMDGACTWETVRSFLAAGFPVAFGFPVPTSLTTDANIPYRHESDGVRGGQAAVAVGYQTDHFGRGQPALLVRTSWGSQWGDNGNGWLPMAYVRRQLARDFWTVMSDDWLDTNELSRPSVVDSAPIVDPA